MKSEHDTAATAAPTPAADGATQTPTLDPAIARAQESVPSVTQAAPERGTRGDDQDGRPPYAADLPLIRRFVLGSFLFFLIGGPHGLLQSLDKMNVNLYPLLPGQLGAYYAGLTLHGVSLALLFTGFFILGFLWFAVVHGLGRPLISPSLSKATWWTSVVGAVLALVPVLAGEASVLWTFYAPLQAHFLYYAGLSLVVVGTWLALLNSFLTWRAWRREHPDRRTPLMAFASLATWTMWWLASIGLAIAVLFYLLPWSAGLREGVNPLLTRALFWFTGHPLVYFWLLPAYVSWYTMLPAQVGGRLFSESLARLVFLLFIPLAIPTGLHHMYADPGVAHGSKVVHGLLTFAVIFPSLVTAFTVVASIEDGARRRGGRGWLAWLLALPWFRNPSVTGQLLAMLIFATGGITGLINAGVTMNMVIHNTMFVVGHLHTQVAAAVTLTFMAVSYWLVPHLTNRRLWSSRLAVWQVWSWFFGMAVMARGMHWMGLGGAPRRSHLAEAPYAQFATWDIAGWLTGAGGLIVAASGLLFLYLMARTVLASPQPAAVEVPVAQPLEPVQEMPRWLDRLTPWVVVTVVLVALAWLPPLLHIAATGPDVPGVRSW